MNNTDTETHELKRVSCNVYKVSLVNNDDLKKKLTTITDYTLSKYLFPLEYITEIEELDIKLENDSELVLVYLN